MKRKVILGLLCVCLMASGCAYVNVTKTAKGYFSPTDPDNIEIFMTMPARKFTEIATVTTVGWKPGNMAKMHNSLRAKSAPLGADAIILTASGVDNSRLAWASGVAVKYDD